MLAGAYFYPPVVRDLSQDLNDLNDLPTTHGPVRKTETGTDREGKKQTEADWLSE